MSEDIDDLIEIERIAGRLLRQLSSSQRRSLLRRMARDIAARNRARIAEQRTPSGAVFKPRRKREPPRVSNHAACFLYPAGGVGEPRKVILRRYAIDVTGEKKYMMTGYDIEAGGIRSFFHDKVVAWLPVDEEHRNKTGGLRRRGNIRRKAMFRRLATARLLRSGVDDHGFWVGFTGRAAEVARIHHQGLRDRPARNAKPVDYPRRPLLGFSEADRQAMLDMLYAHISAIER